MKKTTKVLLAVILVVAMAFTFVACQHKDDKGRIMPAAPQNLEVEGDGLSWDLVEHADYYEVYCGNEKLGQSNTTSFVVKIDETGVYKLKVRAVGDLEKYGYSDFSNEIDYVKLSRLATPQPILSGKSVTWDAVDGARGYSYIVTSDIDEFETVEGESETPSFSFDAEKFSAYGAYKLSVNALAPTDGESSDSNYGEVVYYNSLKLAAPTITTFSSSAVRWNKVDNAAKYLVRIYDKDGKIIEKSTTGSSISVASSITESGVYTVTVQSIGDGKVYLNSDETEKSEDRNFTKLAGLSEENVTFETTADGKIMLKWKTKEIVGARNFSIRLSVKKDGNSSSLTSQTKNIPVKADDETVTPDGEGFYNYSFILDELFVKDGEDGDIEYLLGENYYGKIYDISMTVVNDTDNKIISSETLELGERYLSYRKPQKAASGQFEGYYEITSMGELAYMRVAPDAKYVLTSDLKMNGYEWLPVPTFSGRFDGNGHSLSDFVIQTADENGNAGIFGELTSSAFVGNLNVYEAVLEVEGAKFVGILAGKNSGSIGGGLGKNGVFVHGSVTALGATAGGLVGYNSVTDSVEASGRLFNCEADVAVTGTVAGGLIGQNQNGILMYCNARGMVTAKTEDEEEEEKTTVEKIVGGGLVGINSGKILGAFAVGSVNAVGDATSLAAGGFIGINSGEISKSYSGNPFSVNVGRLDTVEAGGLNGLAGGFIGVNSGALSDCYSTSRAAANVAGGFIGSNNAAITSCFSTGGARNVGVNHSFVAQRGANSSFAKCYYYDSQSWASEPSDGEIRLTQVGLKDELAAGLGDGFGIISGATTAVLKDMVYLEDDTKADGIFKETINPRVNLVTVGRYITSDNSEITLGYDKDREPTLVGNNGEAGIITAKYEIAMGDGVTHYVSLLVTVK